ncbi:response regulator transcription factor [Paracoccus rhizosphaerae]|uniref:Response regulator transcription factor n=1 Tax=Paracoccus rhizosphaerae TaxID=1133347 RepID=A0ABV6CT86_9RHOB|nr:response regulator transcription factor [Paracoccus rhizosphaerae]
MRTVEAAERAITIILADSNPLVLSALSEVFERDERFSLLATSATAEGFLASVVRVPAQLGIIEWSLPSIGGARLMEKLRDEAESPRIVVYGDQSSGAHLAAMGAGAAGFAPRSGSVETLLETCAAVAEGKMVFPYLDVRDLQNSVMQSLSRRETDMLEALSRGLTNRELSRELGISANTVKFHLSNLYDKLSVKNRGQAIASYYASRNG